MKKKVLKIFQSFAQGAISPGGFFQTAAFLGANVKNFLKKRWRKNKNGISEAVEIQA